jgi:hypothetical protein
MTFNVDPAAQRGYASKLGDVERVAKDADRYIAAHGTFDLHEQGIIGFVTPGHRTLMANLHQPLMHLRELGIVSQRALRATADSYERTDERSAAVLDAAYPQTPIPPTDRN